MPAVILDGKDRAKSLRSELKDKIEALKLESGSVPKLVAIELDHSSSFSVYTKSQEKIAKSIGMEYDLISLHDGASQEELIKKIQELNDDKSVTGIILQSPLPKRFDFIETISYIAADKDVEGINPQNKGKMLLSANGVMPPTASAAVELVEASGIDLNGKEAVVVGHSRIVGKPVAMLLLDRLATVTVCHIATANRGNLKDHIKTAEVLVVAVGKPSIIKGEWIKKNAVVVDVGINRVDGKIVGDVEFDVAKEHASYITPVPGGVGPLTTAILMRNCLWLYKQQKDLNR